MHIPWRVRRHYEQTVLWSYRFRPASSIFEIASGSGQRTAKATIIAAGDIALHEFRSTGVDGDLHDPFRNIYSLLTQADLCTANLETVLCEFQPPPGQFGSRLRASPQAVQLLVRAGIDVVSVANNHCLDFGSAALARSLSILDQHGIDFTGIAEDELGHCRPSVRNVNGLRIGVIGYADDFIVGEDYPGKTSPALADPANILSDIDKIKASVDVLIVHLHWGYEFQLYPLLRHRDLARSIADAGAQVVLCHHAHVPMAIEVWNGTLIAHGLGNFFFPSRTLAVRHPLATRSFALQMAVDEFGPIAAKIVPMRLSASGAVEICQLGQRCEMIGILDRLAQRLDEDEHLRQIESDRTIRECHRLLLSILQFAVDGDPRFAEAVRFLRTPRQRQVVRSLRNQPNCSQASDLLRGIREIPNDQMPLTMVFVQKYRRVIERVLMQLADMVRLDRDFLGRVP